MGWSIAIIENGAEVPEEARVRLAREVIGNAPDHFGEVAEDASETEVLRAVFGSEGKLAFDTDHLEHMDWLTGEPTLLRAFARAGTSGRILFGSLQGDNSGKFWGVEFASGHYRLLTASTANILWNVGTSWPGA